MAGSVTPNFVQEYIAKASPSFPFTLKDDAGNPVNLTGATLSAYMLAADNTPTKMVGAFIFPNAALGQCAYQWTLIDVNAVGIWRIYFSAKLPSELYQREFDPVLFVVLPTPEFYGGFVMQEVDLNVGGAPNTATNPIYADVIDRIARVLGHVIVDSLPAITGAVAPQVGGTNVSTSNPLPVTSGQAGLIAPLGTNGANTVGGAEYQFKWAGNVTVQRVVISNETGADVRYELDNTASANSLRLKDGNVLFIQQPCTVLHLFTAANQNVNQAGGIMVRGYN